MLRAILLWAVVGISIPFGFLLPFVGLSIYLAVAHSGIIYFVWPKYVHDPGLVMALPLLAGYVIVEMRQSPVRLKGMKLLLLLWIWLTLASILAVHPEVAYPKLWEYSRAFIIAFLIGAMANSERRVRILLYTIALSLGLLGAKAGFDTIITAARYRIAGPGGILGDENFFCLAIDMVVPMLVWLAGTEPRRWLRQGMRVLAFLCAVAVVGTHSRSGFLGLCLGVLLLVFYSRWKVLAFAGLALAGLLLVSYGPSAALKRYQSIPTAAKTDPSAIGRLQAWKTAIRMGEAHPAFGVGPRNFILEFAHYSDYKPRAPHNGFIALLADAGVPAVVFFSFMIFTAIAQMFWWRKKIMAVPGCGSLATYCLVIQGALTVYLVPVLFVNMQYYDLLYHLVGLGTGLSLVARRRFAEYRAAALASSPGESSYWDSDMGQPATVVEGENLATP
jgi:probable O-glycosylation ligase (exosortase A-associated)